MAADRRLLTLGGAAAGLALAPLVRAHPPGYLVAATLCCLAIALAARPRRGGRASWCVLVVGCAVLAGCLLGGQRLTAIEGAAYRGETGARIDVTGFVSSVPSRSEDTVRVQVQTPRGKLLVEVRGSVPDLAPGAGVWASGVLRPAPGWYAPTLRRLGISHVLASARLSRTGEERGGLRGWLDGVRNRAAAALISGVKPREASLALGFVLGQDDLIDPLTEERFRRSGLAHLLAVSGQNVLLLVLLAAPVLALAGLPLRTRLWALLALIALYVPLAGAGPSIQRAGVMGAAALVALLAGRPSSRAFAMLAAAAVTLAINPLAAGDPGWQLSFAAVASIFVLGPGIRRRLTERLSPGRLGSALAEGAAATVAATVVTAPISAFHFETLSLASLAANLLVLPAVAPAMWIGMAVAGMAQVTTVLVSPLNAVNELLLGYIAQVAAWFGDPAWAQASVKISSPLVAGGAVAATLAAGCWLLRGRGRHDRLPRVRLRRLSVAATFAAVSVAVFALVSREAPPPPGAMRVTVFDVRQGDAILLQPRDGLPVLVDTGPPDGEIGERLREEGVKRLAAAILTHDQSDHSGALGEVLAAADVDRLVFAAAGRRLVAAARAAGATPTRVAEGSSIRSGSLTLTVLWPAQAPPPASSADPNARSIVLLARWRSFEMLLTGDAEAEAAPLDPGPIDVLKVSHHGSADSGLAPLLDRSAPQIAVISVGAGNSYGHPTSQVLAALRARGIATLRTDEDGLVRIDVSRDRIEVSHGS